MGDFTSLDSVVALIIIPCWPKTKFGCEGVIKRAHHIIINNWGLVKFNLCSKSFMIYKISST